MNQFLSDYIITMDDIVREGDPILPSNTEEVKFPLSEDDKETLESMMQFLKNSQDPDTSKNIFTSRTRTSAKSNWLE